MSAWLGSRLPADRRKRGQDAYCDLRFLGSLFWTRWSTPQKQGGLPLVYYYATNQVYVSDQSPPLSPSSLCSDQNTSSYSLCIRHLSHPTIAVLVGILPIDDAEIRCPHAP